VAYFAKLNEENIVTQVIVVANEDTVDQNGIEDEAIGVAFCTNLFGGTWKQTSYSGNIRKNYAGIGFKYDANLDAFVPPQPYASWTLDETTAKWKAPVDYPVDGKSYDWNELIQSWQEVSAEG